MQYYDSDLNSEVSEMDFESDKEPPKEKKYDKKALLKTKDLKIYKKIIQVGEAIFRPARYDAVQIRMKEVFDDNTDAVDVDEYMKESIIECNVGLQQIGDWLNTALENMRKGEISLITVKKIGYDEHTENKTQDLNYYVINLVHWTTIVDLDQDFNFMKKIVQKGSGNERYSEPDEVHLIYTLRQRDHVLLQNEFNHRMLKPEDKIPSNVMKVLKTMKKGEIVECSIKTKRFLELESSVDITNLNIDIDTMILDIELRDMIKVTDIFENGLVLKKTMRKGVHTSKPENSSEIFFNFEIYDASNNNFIYRSSEGEIDLEEQVWKDLDQLRDSGRAFKCYLDEYKISKALKNVLKLTKKMEIAELYVNDTAKYVNYGVDYEAVKKYNPNVRDLKLKYIVKLYNFTEGKNAFTMTIDEKIFHGTRKKETAIAHLKSGNIKKALKTFEHINSYFDLGKFLEEDQIKVQGIQVSTLLNTTLCLQKLENWKKLIPSADKILNIDPYNVKAVYRKALALKHLQEFEPAIEILEKLLERLDMDEDLKKKTDAQQIQDLENLLKVSRAGQNNYLKKQKNMYKTMFSGAE